jgi:N-acetyl-anhydromuramyl-L-alanine amidase AmpD
MIKTLSLLVVSLLFFAGCSAKQEAAVQAVSQPEIKQQTQKEALTVTDMLADFGIEKSIGIRAVDTVVVHTAHSVEGDPYKPENVYNIFKKYNVTPHYMIGRDGIIYKMADENDLAHHAGKSKMKDGRESVNAFSIGVELINSKTDRPTLAQYMSLAKLILDIKSRHEIKYIVGHSDIAPERKSDPWNFDFDTLHAMIAADTKHAKGETK